ncbi:MAG: DMT family transporter [Salibacteraceae bacterium]
MKIDSPSKQYIVLVLLALVWGSSFILMKRGLESFTSIQVAEYRLFIAGITLLPFALKNIRRFPKKRKEQVGVLFVALFGNFFPAFLFSEAQTQLPSGVTGMLNSLVPLFTLIIGFLFFKSKVLIRQVIGVVIGLIGAITLIYFTSNSDGSIPIGYSVMVLVASLCYAISLNTIKAWLHDVPSVMITSFAFMILGPFVTIGLFAEGFWEVAFSSPSHLSSLGYITLLGVLGTALAVLMFNELVKFTTAVFASSVTYLIPIVAMAWGIVDGEELSFSHGVGMILILVGVYIVNRKKKVVSNWK